MTCALVTGADGDTPPVLYAHVWGGSALRSFLFPLLCIFILFYISLLCRLSMLGLRAATAV